MTVAISEGLPVLHEVNISPLPSPYCIVLQIILIFVASFGCSLPVRCAFYCVAFPLFSYAT